MKIGIMQPYFFPYLGYWQLMDKVDLYVIYDDVNYINRGWINRNRILFNGMPRYFNLPVRGASQNKLINQIEVDKDEKKKRRSLAILKEAYHKAPFFDEIYPIVKEMLSSDADTASSFLADSFRFICLYLGIKTERILSSQIRKDTSLRGEDKIIDICNKTGADHYVNAIGGAGLYHEEKFRKHGIELSFLKTDDIKYEQFGNGFVENLSIIDVMMFNSREETRKLLKKCEIISSKTGGYRPAWINKFSEFIPTCTGICQQSTGLVFYEPLQDSADHGYNMISKEAVAA